MDLWWGREAMALTYRIPRRLVRRSIWSIRIKYGILLLASFRTILGCLHYLPTSSQEYSKEIADGHLLLRINNCNRINGP